MRTGLYWSWVIILTLVWPNLSVWGDRKGPYRPPAKEVPSAEKKLLLEQNTLDIKKIVADPGFITIVIDKVSKAPPEILQLFDDLFSISIEEMKPDDSLIISRLRSPDELAAGGYIVHPGEMTWMECPQEETFPGKSDLPKCGEEKQEESGGLFGKVGGGIQDQISKTLDAFKDMASSMKEGSQKNEYSFLRGFKTGECGLKKEVGKGPLTSKANKETKIPEGRKFRTKGNQECPKGDGTAEGMSGGGSEISSSSGKSEGINVSGTGGSSESAIQMTGKKGQANPRQNLACRSGDYVMDVGGRAGIRGDSRLMEGMSDSKPDPQEQRDRSKPKVDSSSGTQTNTSTRTNTSTKTVGDYNGNNGAVIILREHIFSSPDGSTTRMTTVEAYIAQPLTFDLVSKDADGNRSGIQATMTTTLKTHIPEGTIAGIDSSTPTPQIVRALAETTQQENLPEVTPPVAAPILDPVTAQPDATPPPQDQDVITSIHVPKECGEGSVGCGSGEGLQDWQGKQITPQGLPAINQARNPVLNLGPTGPAINPGTEGGVVVDLVQRKPTLDQLVNTGPEGTTPGMAIHLNPCENMRNSGLDIGPRPACWQMEGEDCKEDGPSLKPDKGPFKKPGVPGGR